MAKLSAKARQKLKSSQFALPGKGTGKGGKGAGSYPIPDKAHAINAKARVTQHGTPAEKKKVRAAVKRKFGFKSGGAVIGTPKAHGTFASLGIRR